MAYDSLDFTEEHGPKCSLSRHGLCEQNKRPKERVKGTKTSGRPPRPVVVPQKASPRSAKSRAARADSPKMEETEELKEPLEDVPRGICRAQSAVGAQTLRSGNASCVSAPGQGRGGHLACVAFVDADT